MNKHLVYLLCLVLNLELSKTHSIADAGSITEKERIANEASAAAIAAKEKAAAAVAEAAEADKKAREAAAEVAQAKGTVLASSQAATDNSFADQFKGLGFGVGVGAIFDLGGEKRIKTATVDTAGIVRVQSEDSVRVGAILETHYLWKWDNKDYDPQSRSIIFHGPQVTAVLGDNVIDGIGLGYMVALRRRNVGSANAALKTFNLGVGGMIQPSVQTLGKGLAADQPLPAGDQLRYRTSPKAGVYVVFSVGF